MSPESLKRLFLDLCRRSTNDEALMERCWTELEARYGEPHRHYHTMRHLGHLAGLLEPVAPSLHDARAVYFALFYHDIVYAVPSAGNEEDSAAIARKRLAELNVPAATADRCAAIILATKLHAPADDTDTALFLDADMAILGADAETYDAYAAAVRQEYSLYPDALYQPGRAQVLRGFLAMERIYGTEYFYRKFEAKARLNIGREV